MIDYFNIKTWCCFSRTGRIVYLMKSDLLLAQVLIVPLFGFGCKADYDVTVLNEKFDNLHNICVK